MDQKNNNHHEYNPGNGFLMGLIVGGIATLLFTTKKGREIVKDLTEKGFERLEDLQDSIEEAVEIEDVAENDYLEPQSRPAELEENGKLPVKELKDEKIPEKKREAVSAAKPRRVVKRFFRKKN